MCSKTNKTNICNIDKVRTKARRHAKRKPYAFLPKEDAVQDHATAIYAWRPPRHLEDRDPRMAASSKPSVDADHLWRRRWHLNDYQSASCRVFEEEEKGEDDRDEMIDEISAKVAERLKKMWDEYDTAVSEKAGAPLC